MSPEAENLLHELIEKKDSEGHVMGLIRERSHFKNWKKTACFLKYTNSTVEGVISDYPAKL